MTLRTLNYGNYGIFLIMGNAGPDLGVLDRPSDSNLQAPRVLLEIACEHPFRRHGTF